MTKGAPAWWRFLPEAPGDGPSVEDIRDAGLAGRGALSRSVRAARWRSGAARAAARLRAAEAAAGRRFGRPIRLLFATSQQPRALHDALTLAFAIVGLAVEIEAVDGVSALRERLEDKASTLPGSVDLGILWFEARDGAEVPDSLLDDLAVSLAETTGAPVARVRFASVSSGGSAIAETSASVWTLPVPFGPAPVFDDRFSGSFGAMATPAAADALADAAAAFAARQVGLSPKLVVTDLDDTFWRGVLGEGAGHAAVAAKVNAGYVAVLADLRDRGLVLAIASRNQPADVAAAFEAAASQGLPVSLADFPARAIGWADKASLVADVLDALSLASEHTVLIDDDPVNCAGVAARFPDMDVRRFVGDPDAFAASLAGDPLLAGAAVEGVRSQQYRLRAEVETRRAEAPSLSDFLAGLRTTVTVLPLDGSRLARAAELAVRVNQFRFTALSPSGPALGTRASRLDFMIRLDDAFGPHGLVGLVLASREGDAARIDNLLLSCRALERGVETAMLQALARIAAADGLLHLVGRIETLERNEPARSCLSRHGFVERDGDFVYDLRARPGAGPLDNPPEGVTVDWTDWTDWTRGRGA